MSCFIIIRQTASLLLDCWFQKNNFFFLQFPQKHAWDAVRALIRQRNASVIECANTMEAAVWISTVLVEQKVRTLCIFK